MKPARYVVKYFDTSIRRWWLASSLCGRLEDGGELQRYLWRWKMRANYEHDNGREGWGGVTNSPRDRMMMMLFTQFQLFLMWHGTAGGQRTQDLVMQSNPTRMQSNPTRLHPFSRASNTLSKNHFWTAIGSYDCQKGFGKCLLTAIGILWLSKSI